MKINQRVLRQLRASELQQEARRFEDQICKQLDFHRAKQADSLSPELESLLQLIDKDETQNEMAAEIGLKRGGLLRRWAKLVHTFQLRLGISSAD